MEILDQDLTNGTDAMAELSTRRVFLKKIAVFFFGEMAACLDF